MFEVTLTTINTFCTSCIGIGETPLSRSFDSGIQLEVVCAAANTRGSNLIDEAKEIQKLLNLKNCHHRQRALKELIMFR